MADPFESDSSSSDLLIDPLRSTVSPVKMIQARGVLGEFNYLIDFTAEFPHPANDRVKIIYAENGRGKTNLLRAVYYLLHANAESLQALIEIPIRDLKIEFVNGSFLKLARATDLDGAFTTTVSCPAPGGGTISEELTLAIDPTDFGSRMYKRVLSNKDNYLDYIERVQSLSRSTVFVGDDRRVLSSADDVEASTRPSAWERDVDISSSRVRNTPSGRTLEVGETLDKVERAFTRLTLEGIARDRPSHALGVYSQITSNVLTGTSVSLLAAKAREDLLVKSKALLLRGARFERYGLIRLQQVKQIVEQLTTTRANDTRVKSLHGIIDPYLSSLSDQMDSLAETQKLIDTYVTAVNNFLDRKSMRFNAANGILLFDKHGKRLRPDNLSSGEKHLLLLLSNAVLATDHGSLLIIDEPELSLGLAWQRKLIPELLRCTEGSNVQFLVASHSMQIIGDLDGLVQPTEEIA